MYKKYLLFFLLMSGLIPGTGFPQERNVSKSVFFNPPSSAKMVGISAPAGISVINTGFGILSVFSNQNIFPSSYNQSTISSAIQKNNPQVIFLGANTDVGV